MLGFASITPGPAPLRDTTARFDIAAHDHYSDRAGALIGSAIQWAEQHVISLLEAYVADTDAGKRAWLAAAGFAEVARIPRVLHISDQRSDVLVMHRSCP